MIRITNITGTNSPLELKLRIETPIEQTNAMIFGSALHCYFLKNQEFEKEYTIIPTKDEDLNKDGSIKATILKQIQPQGIPIPQQWLNYFLKVSEIIEKKGYSKIFKSSILEQRLFAKYNVDSLQFEQSEETYLHFDDKYLYLAGTPDLFSKNAIVDIKTVRTAIFPPNLFNYEIKKNGYIMQLVAYKSMLIANNAVSKDAKLFILAISNDLEMPEAQLYCISDNDEYASSVQLNARLSIIHNAFINNHFPLLPIEKEVIMLGSDVLYY